MARARNIKPGFFTNDVLAECSPLARLLFAGLWTITDREGRLEDRPKKIKAEILPYDECDADALLNELRAKGFIVRYQIEAARFIQVVNFNKHQNPHMKESASEIPAPDEHQTSTVQVEELPALAGLNPSSLILNPESLIPHPEAPASPKPRIVKCRAADWEEEFDSMWALYPRKPGMSKAGTLKAFTARVGEGASVPAMLAGVQAYAKYVLASHTEPKYIKAPETFFGPGKHWESDWSPPAGGTGRTSNHQQTIDNLTAYMNEQHEN